MQINFMINVRAATDRFIESNEFKVMYTVSGGIVSFAALEGNQYSEALKLTDFALNEAKTLGRNRCLYILTEKTYRKIFFGRGEIYPGTAGGCAQWLPGFYGFLSSLLFDER